ncbi:GNAT family N-acetyltransferase [Nonlabens ponticola]|uniref:N-acetyltransferase n=1 Tax=Nonlabens ponticola TaxID=2496866 RepID=A0A3S9MUL5_9FLAO|nr:GNAT family N-acetyltransferase [Nonlabens ponticola]AZQ42861.1 N-acetyltransferase [Nonlabens ponticola]
MKLDDIQHKQNDRRGIFYYKKEDHTVAELTYSLEDDVMVIDHTEVDTKLEGKGMGAKMVEKSYAFAKANNYKINPLCPFAEVVFDRNPDWSSVRV